MPVAKTSEEPVGRELPQWRGASAPDGRALRGRLASLEPAATGHLEALADAVVGAPAEGERSLWTYLPYGPFADRAQFAEAFARWRASDDPFHYAIVPTGGQVAQGMLALMRCDTANGVIEIGHVWLAPPLQRTRAATAAFALAATYAFDGLGHRRLEWKCDALNAPSRRAAERLGFTHEGTFRNHMVVKGRNRDTAWYAITVEEWPRVRRGFELWLDDANVDGDGRQRRSLAELRADD